MKWRTYLEYKESGIPTSPVVPSHWSVSRLGFLSTKIGSGKTPSGGATIYQDEGVLFIRSQNVLNEGLCLDDIVYITKTIDEEMAATRVQENDLLLNLTGASIGRSCIVPSGTGLANVNQHVCIIRLKDPSLAKFVSYTLKAVSTKAQIDYAQNGAAREGLNFDQVSKLALVLPSEDDRQSIVTFLDRETAKIDTLITEQRTLIERLKEWRTAMTSQVVTKGMSPDVPKKDSGLAWLGEVPEHWTLKRLHTLFRQEKRQNQVGKPVLSVYRDYGVIFKDSRDDNNNKTPEDLSLYQLVNQGDLVVNKMKAWQGSLGISNWDGITSPDYAVFRPLHDECSAFIHLLLRSERMVSLYRSISNGIRPDQWRLEPDQFLNMYVPLPPLSEQEEISSHVESLARGYDALAEEAKKAIELLVEHRSALITAVVTGKADVRGAVA